MTQDEHFIRRAVDGADLGALRMSLYQLIRDERLLSVPAASAGYNPLRLAEQRTAPAATPPPDPDSDGRWVRELAVRLLSEGIEGGTPEGDVLPDDRQLREMLVSFSGTELSDAEFRLHRDELALEPIPREVRWAGARPARADRFKVAIIGAGFSGIAAAIQLGRLGIDYTLYERRHEIGGTWSINTYPDARVDTTSFSYQFSFEKNYPWSEYFARQPEVRRYLQRVAEKHGVAPHIRLGHEVRSARYDGGAAAWRLQIAGPDGESHEVQANFVVSASGLFSTAKEIEFDGVESFEGEIVHTTNWSDDIAVAGRRVAVIGNGSTGVQLLSKIAASAAHVDVFQRSPQWIAPRERYGQPVEEETRWLLDHLPYYWNWFCYANIRPSLTAERVQEIDRDWQRRGGLISEQNDAMRDSLTGYIRQQLGDRTDLIERVTPGHAPMARRLVVDNGWYRALLRENVELVTDGIRAFSPRGIITTNDREHPVDLVVAATGFAVEKYVWPAEYIGADGISLEERWAEEGPRAYLGMTIPHFPNFFVMYGPNGQNRVGSLVTHIESWARYIALCIVHVVEEGYRSVTVKEKTCTDYNDRMDQATTDLVWLEERSRDRNYYVDRHGRQSVGAPWPAAHYYEMVSRPDFDDFVLDY